MKNHILLFAALFAASLWAGEKVYLWPEGQMPDAQPHQIAAMTDVSRAKGFDADAWRQPYIDWFDPPANPNGTCLILISGGSYKNCCDVRLVHDWARKLTALGCQCVNFVYRTPWPNDLPIYQTAWEDAQRAVRKVRAAAAARGFSPDRIGVMSMSAGSHLATLMATSSLTPAYEPVDDLDATPCNVNWACVFAPAFVLTDGYGKPNSRRGEVDAALADCFTFDTQTCPMCLLHGGADVYSPNGSTRIYRELRKRKVPAEVHIVPDKGHGAHGFDRAVEFMRQMEFFGPLEPEVALLDRFASDDARAVYEKEDLWPQGQMPDAQAHQCTPYLEWNIPSNLTTKAIQVIWSGGAYKGNGPDSFEVAPFRRYLNEKGMAVVTVKYRTPRPNNLAKHVTAWEDAQRAIRKVRAEAAARGLDPNCIGIMGSSAGGHLALQCATTSRTDAYWPVDGTDKIQPNVQWAVCIYPAYSLTDGAEKANAHGGNEDDAVLVPEFAFDLATPPMLFLHGDADGWAAMNSVKAWEKLRFMGIQGELHTLVRRGHCFQRNAAPGTASYNWMDRIWEFLLAKGFLADRTAAPGGRP